MLNKGQHKKINRKSELNITVSNVKLLMWRGSLLNDMAVILL